MSVTSREIFPQCGLSYLDCMGVAGMNRTKAAKKLGVSYRHFRRVIQRLGMEHHFDNTSRPRPKCLSKDDIAQLAREGYTRKDAAAVAGVCYSYFKALVVEHKLQHLFPTTGKANWISRRGYTGSDTVGHGEE